MLPSYSKQLRALRAAPSCSALHSELLRAKMQSAAPNYSECSELFGAARGILALRSSDCSKLSTPEEGCQPSLFESWHRLADTFTLSSQFEAINWFLSPAVFSSSLLRSCGL